MLERFTLPARQVVVLAKEEARLLGHSCIGTEHLLLGLLRERQGTAARLLTGLDIGIDEVRARVRQVAGPVDATGTDQISFTPGSRKAFGLALEEALPISLNYIDTRHILFGLVRENHGVGARILRDLGVDAEKVRTEIIRLRGPVDLPPRKRTVICGECQSSIEFEIVITHRPSLSFPVSGTVHRTCPGCGEESSISYGIAG